MKLLRPGDLVVIVLAAAMVGASYAAFWGERTAGQAAIVSVDRQVIGRFPLGEPRRLEIPGRLGTSLLAIADDRIRFLDSPCPNRYCVHAGWLGQTGEVAACVPNGVVVEVVGGERQFDAINL